MTTSMPSKKDVALALLERSTIRVFLDPRKAGVIVPPWFKTQPQLLLDVGLNTAVPIPDLHLDDEAMSCTLSFNRAPFYCVIPWSAVFAVVGDGDRAVVWPEDVPAEIQLEPPPAPKKPAVSAAPPLAKEAKTGPKAVPGRKESDKAGERGERSTGEKKKREPKEGKKRAPLAAVPEKTAEPPRPARPKRELPPYLRVIK
jgi:stringent starvation protein B